jgi:large subunit ribosomal protein L31
MKKGIHPQVNPVIFVDEASGQELITTSTMTAKETRDIDGISYFVIRCDVTSFSHPFFTGEMRFVDRQGRVDKFQKKMQLAQTKQQAVQAKKAKKSTGPAKSYREILRDQQGTMRAADKEDKKKVTTTASTSVSPA